MASAKPTPKKQATSSPTSAPRGVMMTAVLAARSMGKSTLIAKIVDQAVAAGRRVLVIDPEFSEPTWHRNKSYKKYSDIKDVPDTWKGVCVVPYSPKEILGTPTFKHLWDKMDPRMHNGKAGPWQNMLLVLDDTNFYARGVIDETLMDFLIVERRWYVDTIVTAHSWGQLPPIFFTYIDMYVIGPTLLGPEQRSSLIKGDALKRMQAIRAEVNAHKRAHPQDFEGCWRVITADGAPFGGNKF